MNDTTLYHHGVKGMKWGVRRYRNKDGSLTPQGIKRYATKEYAKRVYDANTATVGKIYDKYTGAHKIAAKAKYEQASAKKNLEAANKYVADKTKSTAVTKKKIAKSIAKGSTATAKALNKVGKVYLTDQLFFGGAGTKLTKEATMIAGRAAVTAYTMARGGYDIRWYDKQGRRVG